ncbi:KH domain containing protein [Aphelenchoides fujianensis]|nr:KH domain containing protein [Aphelenchoides fujianensis]
MADLTPQEFETPAVVVGQKRGNTDNNGPAAKRSNVGVDPELQIKVLIPAAAVGALIGKGGESMRALKNESNCRVQMSKGQELFQNTNERICLVKGKVSSSMIVMKAILEKIQEKLEAPTPPDQFDLKGVERRDEMKVVVPNTSAGMVIGKSGSSIKASRLLLSFNRILLQEIREVTGANIQVYPKAGSEEAKQSMERVITVGAENNNVLLDAIHRVLEKVAADPLHAQEAQKTEFNAGGPQFNNFGPRVDQSNGQFGGMPQFGGNPPVWQQQPSMGGAPTPDNSFGKQNFNAPPGPIKYNGIPLLNNSEVISFLDNLQNTLRTSGFTENAVGEIMAAMHVLTRYNVIGLGLGLGVAAMAQSRNEAAAAASNPHMMQPTPQPVPPMPTQRYDLTQPPMMPPSGNGISSLLESNDGRQDFNWRR